MSTIDLPAPIRAFVEATNGGDPNAFAAAFTDDAYLNDWGREYRGRDGVRDWDRTMTFHLRDGLIASLRIG